MSIQLFLLNLLRIKKRKIGLLQNLLKMDKEKISLLLSLLKMDIGQAKNESTSRKQGQVINVSTAPAYENVDANKAKTKNPSTVKKPLTEEELVELFSNSDNKTKKAKRRKI